MLFIDFTEMVVTFVLYNMDMMDIFLSHFYMKMDDIWDCGFELSVVYATESDGLYTLHTHIEVEGLEVLCT